MTIDMARLGTRIRRTREAAGLSQTQVAEMIGVSQPTYSRLETGTSPTLDGGDLVLLADALGVRAASLIGVQQIEEDARIAARTDGSSAAMDSMREYLYAYLELDAYLTDRGVAK
nr:helix-turn-helix transcriptional regulator [Actinomycetales bacterium]